MKNPPNFGCSQCSRFNESMFKGLTSEEIESMTRYKTCNMYKKGTIIIHEGSRPTGVFCIRSGKAKVFKHGDGKDHIVKIAKEGDLLGYKAMLAEDNFPVSIETLEDCHICFVPKQDFIRTLFSSPMFTSRILQAACKELEVLTESVTNMAQKTVKERLAWTLLMLKDTYGADAAEDGSVAINLKREDIANIVGTATETLIRLLHEFKEEQFVDIDGRKIIVKDIRALKREAGVF